MSPFPHEHTRQQYLEDAADQCSMDMNQPQGGRQWRTADDADQNRQSEQGRKDQPSQADIEEDQRRLRRPHHLASILPEKEEMVGRPFPMADGEAVSNGFGQIGLGGLHRINNRFAACDMRGDGRGKCAAGAVRVGGLDKLAAKHIKNRPS